MTLEDIVEEFLERHRQGESPTASEYADRFPELANEICATLPARRLDAGRYPRRETAGHAIRRKAERWHFAGR